MRARAPPGRAPVCITEYEFELRGTSLYYRIRVCLGLPGTTWYYLVLPGTTWYYLVLLGTTWYYLVPAKDWQDLGEAWARSGRGLGDAWARSGAGLGEVGEQTRARPGRKKACERRVKGV